METPKRRPFFTWLEVAVARTRHGALVLGLSSAVASGAACSGEDDLAPRDQALLDVKETITVELDALHRATTDLRDAAPAPDADGWNDASDHVSIERMRAAWKRARSAYERIEGAIAVLFADIDASTDERYDGFVETEADDDLFDGEGVTGVHGIERILWSNEIPAEVVAFESELPHYQPARFPMNEAEARAFRDELCQRLVDDVDSMRRDFRPLALDPAAALRGVIGSLIEQREKLRLAQTGEDESRYARHTLADMRENLAGGRRIYEAFRPWLRSAEGGAARDTNIVASMERVRTGYDAVPGDAVPPVPEGFSTSSPTAAHLATPYGMLFSMLEREADPEVSDSLVHEMNAAGDLLGIARLPD